MGAEWYGAVGWCAASIPAVHLHTHTATRCITAQARRLSNTLCTLQNTARHCKTLQHTVTVSNWCLSLSQRRCLIVMPLVQATHCVLHSVLQRVAVRCCALHCVAVCCSVLQRVAACCSVATEVLDSVSSGDIGWVPCLSTLQHTATHCNTLQHTATHCNKTVSVFWSTSFCVVPVDSRMQRSSICRGATLQHIVTLQHCTHCHTSTLHTATLQQCNTTLNMSWHDTAASLSHRNILSHCYIGTQCSTCRSTTLQQHIVTLQQCTLQHCA